MNEFKSKRQNWWNSHGAQNIFNGKVKTMQAWQFDGDPASASGKMMILLSEKKSSSNISM